MNRKITQIEAVQVSENNRYYTKLYALCDDGSIHCYNSHNNDEWSELPRLEGEAYPTQVGVKESEPSPAFLKGKRDATLNGPEYKCPYHYTNKQIVNEWWDGFTSVYPNSLFRL